MLENAYHFRGERRQCGGWGEREREREEKDKKRKRNKKERGEGSELFRIRPVM